MLIYSILFLCVGELSGFELFSIFKFTKNFPASLKKLSRKSTALKINRKLHKFKRSGFILKLLPYFPNAGYEKAQKRIFS
jgi:hypothetical protein